MSQQTLYWYDFETFGLNPRRDRPAQFAGIRSDTKFNIIGDPLVLYCKPAADMLPDPESCLITGITPQKALSEGFCEAHFIAEINNEFSRPNTCVSGYNNIRFDDEVTRNTLYRNFFDPYAREWQSGNSRWDVIDLLRLARALRPDGIQWPENEDGTPSFRLEKLTAANGIEHQSAHDALSDVFATIAVAKLVKSQQPRLFDYVFRNRGKFQAAQFLDVSAKKPVVHVSGKYPARKCCLAVVLPIVKHPVNKNATIVYDLSENADALISLDAENIRQRVFTSRDELPEGQERIALKAVHANRCPVLVPITTLREEDAKRLEIDLNDCQRNLEKIKNAPGLHGKIEEVFAEGDFPEPTDPDDMLYSGGFFSDHDKSLMETIRSSTPDRLKTMKAGFEDSRLPEMLFRYRARNFPETLDNEEIQRWAKSCYTRLSNPDTKTGRVFDVYNKQLDELRHSAIGQEKLAIVDALEDYGRNLQEYLQGFQK